MDEVYDDIGVTPQKPDPQDSTPIISYKHTPSLYPSKQTNGKIRKPAPIPLTEDDEDGEDGGNNYEMDDGGGDDDNYDMNEDYDDVSNFINNGSSPAQPSSSTIRKAPTPPSFQATKPTQNHQSLTLKLTPSPPVVSTQLNQDDLPYDKMYYAKWDCTADTPEELPLKYGDVVVVVSQKFDNFAWWVGRVGERVGLVPRDYLTPAYQLVC